MKLVFLFLFFLSFFLCKSYLDYENEVNILIDSVFEDSEIAIEKISYIHDYFGPRPAGSDNYFNTANHILDMMTNDGFENVMKDEIKDIPSLMRGKEELKIIEPFERELSVIGLHPGIAGSIEGEAIIVESIEQFEEVNCVDKIAILHPDEYEDYETYAYHRMNAGIIAQEYGCLAVLISAPCINDPFTPYQNHAGTQWMINDDTGEPLTILTGVIPFQDSNLLKRLMDERGEMIVLRLTIETTFEYRDSFNIIGEIEGTEYPDEVIVITSHLDSWDQTYGVVDDLAAVIIHYEVIRHLLKLGMRPKRTIRFIAFCVEELNVDSYMNEEIIFDTNEEIIFANDHDLGCFKPTGYAVSENVNLEIFSQLLEYQKQRIGDLFIEYSSEVPPNVEPIVELEVEKRGGGGGVPYSTIETEFGMRVDDFSYQLFHHTKSDRLEAIDSDEIDLNIASILSLIYVIADMDEPIKI